MSEVPSKNKQEMAFTVQSIECIACTPVFRRQLGKINGVLEVKELPITNKVIVVFDAARLKRESLREEITEVSEMAGFGSKVIFSR